MHKTWQQQYKFVSNFVLNVLQNNSHVIKHEDVNNEDSTSNFLILKTNFQLIKFIMQ